MELIKSVSISLVILVLSINLKIVHAPPTVLENNLSSIFLVQYDLILLALSILLGSYFSAENVEEKNLFIPTFIVFVMLILCLALDGITKTKIPLVVEYMTALSLVAPNALGLFATGFAVFAVRS